MWGRPFAGGGSACARLSGMCGSVTMAGRRFTLRRADLLVCYLAEERNVPPTIAGSSLRVCGVVDLR